MNKIQKKKIKRDDHISISRNFGGRLRQSEKSLELALIRTYPRQVTWETWLPATPFKLTTTVATGLIASVTSVGSGLIQNFAARFGMTFVEYRIIRAKFQIRLFSSTNPGVIQVWLDEKNASVPTLAEGEERATLTVSASATDTMPKVNWTCADPLDLQYLAIGASSAPVSFKVFTNNVNFGSSIVATDYVEIAPMLQLQFRGLQGV